MKHEEEIEVVKKYKEDIDKYEHLKRKKLMNAKENKTLELLNSFRERLFNAKQKTEETETEEVDEKPVEATSTSNITVRDDLEAILTHKFDLDEEIKQKVIDANIRDNDRYDIYDPRNSLNKRKREISKELMKEKRKSYKH